MKWSKFFERYYDKYGNPKRRNCDKYKTMEDAMKAWRKVCTYAKEMRGCEGCIYQHSKHEAPCVVEWLYAEA